MYSRHLVFWADDDDEQGDTHTNFKLTTAGEVIALYDTEGSTLIDSITFGVQDTDIAFGRYQDGADEWCYLSEPTPGAANRMCRSGRPEFTRPGGTYTGSLDVEITIGSPTAVIYYTLNGAAPDATSTRYTGPISITETTWVRARVYDGDSLPRPDRKGEAVEDLLPARVGEVHVVENDLSHSLVMWGRQRSGLGRRRDLGHCVEQCEDPL